MQNALSGRTKVSSVSEIMTKRAVFLSPNVSSSKSSVSMSSLSSRMSNGAKRAPHEIKIDLAVLPVATCQGRIHHFSSLFLGLPCFPCSKSWRMTRFSLSSTLWVLVSEKCISTKYLVLSIFCCRQGVNRPVVLVLMLSLMFLPLGAKKTHGLQFTVPCAFMLFY